MSPRREDWVLAFGCVPPPRSAAFIADRGARCLLGHAPEPRLRGEAWPEADALFHQDARWLGADVAYSVDLGTGRVLWLFGDTFIATSAANVRSQSVLARNSVAIEQGYDPTQAPIAFSWGTSTKRALPPEWAG